LNIIETKQEKKISLSVDCVFLFQNTDALNKFQNTVDFGWGIDCWNCKEFREI